MNEVIKFLRKIPVETYLLIILPSIIVSILVIGFHRFFSYKTVIFYIFYVNQYFITIVIFSYAYIFIRILASILKVAILKEYRTKKAFLGIKDLILSQIYINAIIVFSTTLLMIFLEMLGQIIPMQRIISSSDMLIHYDKLVFGSNLLFSLSNLINRIQSDLLSWILFQAYDIFSIVLAIFVLILLLTNKNLARKFILFFFITTFISLPIWYTIPVLNPINRYIGNVLDVAPPQSIQLDIQKFNPDSRLSSYLNTFSKYYKEQNFLNVFAFPSMHAAYSFGIIIFAFLLWRPLVFITIPWFILEMIGAVYLGQHYALDLFLGGIIATAAYFLVTWLYHLEKKYYIGKDYFLAVDMVQNDVKRTADFLKQTFSYGNYRNK